MMNSNEQQGFIFGMLLMLANRLQIVGDKLDPNVTLKQWLLIVILLKSDHPSPTLGEVAKIFGCSRQNIKKLAVILEKQDLVALSKDDRDARAVRVQLTARCRDYFAEREERENSFMRELFRGFDEKRTQGLFDGMRQLADNLEQIEQSLRTAQD